MTLPGSASASDTRLRFRGVDDQEKVWLGPVVCDRTLRIDFGAVPIHVHHLLIETMSGNTTVAVHVAHLQMKPGQTYVLNDPETTTPVLASIVVAPQRGSIPLGFSRSLTADGIFSDQSVRSLSTIANWTSADGSVVALSDNVASGAAPGSTTISAACGGLTGDTTMFVRDATVTEVQIVPPYIQADRTFGEVGTNLQAVARFTDGSSETVTSNASWTSGNIAVASVSNAAGSRGVLNSTGDGSTTVTATVDGKSATAPVHWGPPASSQVRNLRSASSGPQVYPNNFTLAAGTSCTVFLVSSLSGGVVYYHYQAPHFAALYSYWSTSNPTIASVASNQTTGPLTGPYFQTTVTALAAGTALVYSDGISYIATPQFQPAQANCTVNPNNVSITPANVGTIVGLQTAFNLATGQTIDASLTELASWSSSDPTVATISNSAGSKGQMTAVGGGFTTITATLPAIQLNKSVSIFVASSAQLQSILITPAVSTTQLGFPLQLTATGIYSDGSRRDLSQSAARWSSSNSRILVVGFDSGVATGLVGGVVTVTASMQGVSGTAQVGVTQ